MIRLQYKCFCDVCKTVCFVEEYDCSSNPRYHYPRPSTQFSVRFGGQDMDLCSSCNEPMVEAKNKVIAEFNEAKRKLKEFDK